MGLFDSGSAKVKYATPPGYWENTGKAQTALHQEQARLQQFAT